MLRRLELKNCFKHAHSVFDFTDGMTAIIGPNESGKSLIFEMIAYCLFGTVALRGAAPDYKKLSATLDFEVSGVEYRVSRTGSKCVLMRGEVELATGIKTVNPKIIEILGYDYKVFSIANCANQDELTKLGTMKPTERKQMVDNVIGLTIIDDLNKFVTSKISELNTEVSTMRATIQCPEAPEKPEDYEDLVTLQAKQEDLAKKQSRYDYLNQWLTQTRQVPEAPEDPKYGDVKELMEKVQKQREENQRYRELKLRLEKYIEPKYTAEQLQEMADIWADIQQRNDLEAQYNRLTPTPAYTREQLNQFTQQAESFHKWQQKQQLLSQGEHECPSCNHTWPVASDALQQYESIQECEAPSYIPTARDYATMDAWEAETEQRRVINEQLVDFEGLEAPTLAPTDIAAQRRALDEYEEVQELRVEFTKLEASVLGDQPAYERMLEGQQTYLQKLAGYNEAVRLYNEWVKEYETNSAEFVTLKEIPYQLQQLREQISRVTLYEHQQKNYLYAMEQYNAHQKTIETKSLQLNQYERVRIALKEARSTVKKYLTPSLNRVASALLAQMTGGARSHIEVSEDFDINVDGQPLNTLSGSGKAVANLAIRIALGQVLIAKKFPVFMADEIDGSMDEDRAEFTSECLRRLTKHVPQLLLISHKRPDADHYIELGR